MDTKTVVLMPTYNEIENIDRMVSQVRAQDVSILILSLIQLSEPTRPY
mgnify:CR=1 FL=1